MKIMVLHFITYESLLALLFLQSLSQFPASPHLSHFSPCGTLNLGFSGANLKSNKKPFDPSFKFFIEFLKILYCLTIRVSWEVRSTKSLLSSSSLSYVVDLSSKMSDSTTIFLFFEIRVQILTLVAYFISLMFSLLQAFVFLWFLKFQKKTMKIYGCDVLAIFKNIYMVFPTRI